MVRRFQMFKEHHIELTKKPTERKSERTTNYEQIPLHAIRWVDFYYEFYYESSAYRE